MTQKERNEDMEMKKIYKAPILYFISFKYKIANSEDFFIETQPVIMDLHLVGDSLDSEDEYGESIQMTPRQHILGIVPAPVGMFKVYTYDANGEKLPLGFEYPNLEHPNWEELAEKETAPDTSKKENRIKR